MAAFTAMFVLCAVISGAVASDPDSLQDICVADVSSGIKVNGYPCKVNATAEDFFFAGLAQPAATNNTLGYMVTAANVQKVPGLNTQGLSMTRVDYASGGLNPPHVHPRASEVVFILYGELDVGFITTANVVISKKIKAGEMFVFPQAVVHYLKNNGPKPAAAISAFNSQNPGVQSLAASLFAATPAVPNDVLTKAFQIGTKEVNKIKSRLAPKK